jgi:hypothetical protein
MLYKKSLAFGFAKGLQGKPGGKSMKAGGNKN